MRPYIFKYILLVAAPVLLASCTASLQELQQISPAASDFNSSLAAEYLAYSQSELEQGRDFSSSHFAKKGLMASRGEKVAPDEAQKGTEKFADISESRQKLVEILNDDVKHTAPQKAARAQMLFDCWNEQESNKSLKVIVSCAEEFNQIYDDLQQVADNLTHGAFGKSTFYFYTGSSVLDAEGRYVVAKVAAHLAGINSYAVELDANYNIKDNKSYKGRLAYKRLAVVRDALIKAGVPGAKIFFAKQRFSSDSGKTVYLGNDKMVENSNKFDIIVTSSRHLNAVSK